MVATNYASSTIGESETVTNGQLGSTPSRYNWTVLQLELGFSA